MNTKTVPTTSQVDRGSTTPLLGRTQYFLGLVVLTYYPHVSKGYQEKNVRQSLKKRWDSVGLNTAVYRRITLKATVMSVLLVIFREQEICLSSSTGHDRKSQRGQQGNQEKSDLKVGKGSKGVLGTRGARNLQGNWSSGGSTSRRSQGAAMVVPREEGGSGGKRVHKVLDCWGR